MTNETVNTIPVEIPPNEQNNVQQFNDEQINVESLNHQPEEPMFPIIAYQISNNVCITEGIYINFFY